MNLIVCLSFLVSFVSVAQDFRLPLPRGEYKPLKTLYYEDHTNKKQLQSIKYYLMKGKRAEVTHLGELYSLKKTKQQNIFLRYMAINHFLKRDFSRSYEILKSKSFQEVGSYKHICLIYTLNKIALNLNSIQNEWKRCKSELSSDLSASGSLWMDTLVSIKTLKNDFPFKNTLSVVPWGNLGAEELKLFLKLTLFLNQENLVADKVTSVSEEHLKDEEVRELIGVLLVRNKMIVLGWKFLDGIENINALAIKGDIFLMQNKSEMAYDFYLRALKKKSNSFNALSRLVPLSILLQRYDEGEFFATSIEKTPLLLNQISFLRSYFLTEKNNLKEAYFQLLSQFKGDYKSMPKEMIGLLAYQSMRLKDPKSFSLYAHRGCDLFDLMSCYMMIHYKNIDELFEKISEEEEISLIDEESVNMNVSLFDEVPLINQKDIEELDEKEIKIKF
jgi:hypothetical protein